MRVGIPVRPARAPASHLTCTYAPSRLSRMQITILGAIPGPERQTPMREALTCSTLLSCAAPRRRKAARTRKSPPFVSHPSTWMPGMWPHGTAEPAAARSAALIQERKNPATRPTCMSLTGCAARLPPRSRRPQELYGSHSELRRCPDLMGAWAPTQHDQVLRGIGWHIRSLPPVELGWQSSRLVNNEASRTRWAADLAGRAGMALAAGCLCTHSAQRGCTCLFEEPPVAAHRQSLCEHRKRFAVGRTWCPGGS